MISKTLKFLLLAILPIQLFSQGVVEGVVKDALTGESLIGVNIVYSTGKGTVTDIDGNYSIALAQGAYEITASYVGYEAQTKRIDITDGKISLDFEMKTIMLSEVEVVGDMARSDAGCFQYHQADEAGRGAGITGYPDDPEHHTWRLRYSARWR